MSEQFLRAMFDPAVQRRVQAWISKELEDHPKTGPIGFGMDTNSNSIEVSECHNGAEDIEIGTFDEGWITNPARNGECPNCSGQPAALVHSHMDSETVVIDCLGCRDRVAILVGGERRA